MIRILIISLLLLPRIAWAATSVSQYGITWTFDGDYTVGQYFNGDYYVIDPGGGVTINSVSPAPSYAEFTGTAPNTGWSTYQDETGFGTYRYMNGTMVNPEVGDQSYDSFTKLYAVGQDFSTTLWTANQYPLTIEAPGTVVSVDSMEDNPGGTYTYLFDGGYLSSGTYRPCIEASAVLTVLSEAPASPSTTFRPGIFDSSKTHYSLNDIQWDILPDWPTTANTPSTATIASYWVRLFQRPWTGLHGQGTAHRHLGPVEHTPVYHGDVGHAISHAAALMMVS